MQASPGRTPLSELARGTGWSERHLRRRFVEQVGVGPRSYGRILRFQQATRALTRHPGRDLATAALDLGYCDHAHFAREFRELADMTATEYLRSRAYTLDPGYARVVSDSSKT